LENNKAFPFLRWAGGKNWLIKYLDLIVGKKNEYNNYHEPFLGGASLFFALSPPNESYLSDLNSELIETYRILQENPEKIISELSEFRNSESFYYRIRQDKNQDPIFKASRFIFLNQTSFNGIFRVNLQGEYNVPYGFRKKPFFNPILLREVSNQLRKTHFFCCDFADTINNIEFGDLVYLDPPYTVSHNNNGFIKYNQKLFSLEDQQRLSDYIDKLKEIGAFYILSNAFHPKIYEIFNKNDKILTLERASLIGGKNATRGKVKEYLFTNLNSH